MTNKKKLKSGRSANMIYYHAAYFIFANPGNLTLGVDARCSA